MGEILTLLLNDGSVASNQIGLRESTAGSGSAMQYLPLVGERSPIRGGHPGGSIAVGWKLSIVVGRAMACQSFGSLRQ